MQSTQNSENNLTTVFGEMSLSSDSGVGEKRTWDMMNGDSTNVLIVSDKQQGDNNQTEGTSDIA